MRSQSHHKHMNAKLLDVLNTTTSTLTLHGQTTAVPVWVLLLALPQVNIGKAFVPLLARATAKVGKAGEPSVSAILAEASRRGHGLEAVFLALESGEPVTMPA